MNEESFTSSHIFKVASFHGYDSTDTIVGVASGSDIAPKGVSLIRISGFDLQGFISRFFKRLRSGKLLADSRGKSELQSRQSYYGSIYDDEGEFDDVLLVYFKAPYSFTGEDVIEVSCHGNYLIARRFIAYLERLGVRQAEAGEFTFRAFKNGKLSLDQAESLASIIHAQSPQYLKSSYQNFKGRISNAINSVRQPLREILALCESLIDYVDEDLPISLTSSELAGRVQVLRGEVENLAATYKRGAMLKHGLKVALVGYPNVGKSTLFNCLLNRDRAIVSDIAGTTRDFLEESFCLHGYQIVLTDTAGIRITACEIEKIGIERSLEVGANSDLVLLVLDSYVPRVEIDIKVDAVFINKADLLDDKDRFGNTVYVNEVAYKPYYISGKLLQVEPLTDFILSCIKSNYAPHVNQEQGAVITEERQFAALKNSLENFENLPPLLRDPLPLELISFEIRDILKKIEGIVGETTNDDILGMIFSKFCIGK